MALLDVAAIVHPSGVCLWARELSSAPAGPLMDAVMRTSATDGIAAERLEVGQSSVRCTVDAQTGLIFMLAFPRVLSPPYIAGLLASLKALFLSLFSPLIHAIIEVLSGHDPTGLSPALRRRLFGPGAWRTLWKGWEDAFDRMRREVELNSSQALHSAASTPSREKTGPDEPKKADTSAPATPGDDAESIARNVAAFKARQKLGKKKGGVETPGSDSDASVRKVSLQKRPGGRMTEADIDALDFSSDKDVGAVDLTKLVDQKAMGTRKGELYEVAEYAYADEDDEPDAAPSGGGFFARLSDTVGLTAKPMTQADLAPALTAMRQQLMAKNVARDVAEKICDGVGASLVGKKLGGGALTTKGGAARREVRKALETSLTRVLTPKTPTDVLLEATRKARSHDPTPYTLAFVGVNGVGKSTTLAKVAFWLLQNGRKVLIAACDTFRSGAVEQLRIQCVIAQHGRADW